jgi:hypothetical protein
MPPAGWAFDDGNGSTLEMKVSAEPDQTLIGLYPAGTDRLLVWLTPDASDQFASLLAPSRLQLGVSSRRSAGNRASVGLI